MSSSRSRRSAGSRRSQSSWSSPSASWAHSAAARIDVGDAVGQPREGGGVVEVGDGDVGVALDDERARRPRARGRASIAPAGSGPLRTRSPATRTASGFAALIALRTASSAAALPWTSPEQRDPRHQRSTDASGMMKLRVASQATSPSTLATPRPRPKRRPSFSIVTSRRSVSPGHDDPLEAALVDPGEQPDPVAEPRLLGDVDGHRLGERLDLEDAGHDRQAREVALEEPLGRGHGLEPDDPLRLRVVLDDPVDEQERPAVRDERLDLAGRVDVVGGVERRGRRSVTGGSSWRRSVERAVGSTVASSLRTVRAGLHRVEHGVGPRLTPLAAARNAALPTRSSRFVVNRPSRKASLREERPVDRHVRRRARRRRARRGRPGRGRSPSRGRGPRR